MVNKVTLVGNVGTEPEVKELTNGSVATFSLATSERYKDKSGQKQEKTEWHNIVAYGNVVDVIKSYVNKGDKLYIEGSIHTRKWEDKDGNTRYSTEIKLRDLTMLGGGSTAAKSEPVAAGVDDGDDDLPF